jgi:protein-tyrosine-phosphatase
MAAALFNLYADRTGLDLSSAKPQRLTYELAETVSVLVTMGCAEVCPFVPNLRTIDWALPDREGQPLRRYEPSVTRFTTV